MPYCLLQVRRWRWNSRLDRCSRDVVLAVREAIKLYLDVARTGSVIVYTERPTIQCTGFRDAEAR